MGGDVERKCGFPHPVYILSAGYSVLNSLMPSCIVIVSAIREQSGLRTIGGLGELGPGGGAGEVPVGDPLRVLHRVPGGHTLREGGDPGVGTVRAAARGGGECGGRGRIPFGKSERPFARKSSPRWIST